MKRIDFSTFIGFVGYSLDQGITMSLSDMIGHIWDIFFCLSKGILFLLKIFSISLPQSMLKKACCCMLELRATMD